MIEETKFPSQLAERFQVRMPDGLRDRIAAAAEANNRSMNAEIVATLEQAYPESDLFSDMIKLFRTELERHLNNGDYKSAEIVKDSLKSLIDIIQLTIENNQTIKKDNLGKSI